MSLAIRVGDRTITGLTEDLTFSRGLHGPAACSLRFRDDITRRKFPAFERVYVYDQRATLQWEGRLEDPGRSIDGEGKAWDMGAVGEAARASDKVAPLIYIDTDLSRWIREQLDRVTSANGSASDLPSATGTDCLLLQYNPGQPIDSLSSIVMGYRAIQEAGMEIGGIEYTHVAAHTSVQYENRLFVAPGTNPANGLRTNAWSTTPVSRSATIGSGDPIPAGATRIELTARRVGTATNIGSDLHWAAYYNISAKAVRLGLDGTKQVNDAAGDVYGTGRGVYAHEVVTDVLARLLGDAYDVPNATIDTTSTFQIQQFAFPDGLTPAQVFDELMALQPDWYWQVGPSNASGKPTFKWCKWPEHVRYEFSMRDGLDIPGNNAEMFNEVVVRYVDRRGDITVKTYAAGTTIGGITVPAVKALDDAGVTRAGYIDLSDEQASADKTAAEWLLEHGTPPSAGTLTVARKVYDHDLGRMVEPYEIQPGHLCRIRELGDSASDLTATGRDGKSVFRIMGMEYRHDSRSATVELDAAPKTDEATLAGQVSKRIRKR